MDGTLNRRGGGGGRKRFRISVDGALGWLVMYMYVSHYCFIMLLMLYIRMHSLIVLFVH